MDWASFKSGWASSLSLCLFLLIQISHAIMANSSKLFPSSFMMLTRSHSDSKHGNLLLTFVKDCTHPSRRFSQFHIACSTSSSLHLYYSHRGLSSTFRLCKLTLVWSAFEQAHQRSTLTLFGTFSRQMRFQNRFTSSALELDGAAFISDSHNN